MAFVPVCRVVVIAVVGVILLGIGIAISPVLQLILHSEISQILPLTNGTDTFNAWRDPRGNATMYLQFWVFDVSNSYEVINYGAKPALRQMGPYTYYEYKVKTQINFDDNDGTVSYREQSSYVFSPELSAGSENDTFTTLNVPVYGIEYILKKSAIAEKVLDSILVGIENEHLFVELSVHDLLWGYEDKFLKDLVTLLKDPTIAELLKIFNVTLPKIDSHFGLYYGLNGTDDGLYSIYSGKKDVSLFTSIDTWNGVRSLPYWKSSYCNLINGTDGSQFPPFVDKASVLYLFSTQVCRSLIFVYDSDTSLEGISLYQFKPPASLFAYPPANVDNVCYCADATSCPQAGVLALAACQSGAPIFISQPHFLHGSYDYLNGVIGLSPNEAEHDSYVSVEPNTGVVLQGAKRLQLNIGLTNITAIKEASKLPPSLMLPLVWLNESATANQATLDSFKSQFTIYLNIANIAQYVLIGIGSFIVVCDTGFIIKKHLGRKKDDLNELLGDQR